MRVYRASCVAILACVCAGGCGTSSGAKATGPATTFGPRGGPIVALTPDSAFAELVLEAVGKRRDTQVAAYFYADAALSIPLRPEPTDVRFDQRLPGQEIRTLALKPAPGVPAGVSTRFASSPGPCDVDRLIGTLHATVNGQGISREVVSPR